MQIFAAVVRGGSFSAAARRLGLSPSAVSKKVSALEGRLATRLIHRTTRRLNLTEAGRVFLERSEAILSDVEEAEAMADEAKQDLENMSEEEIKDLAKEKLGIED